MGGLTQNGPETLTSRGGISKTSSTILQITLTMFPRKPIPSKEIVSSNDTGETEAEHLVTDLQAPDWWLDIHLLPPT